MNNTLKNKFKSDYEKQFDLPSDHLWGRIEEHLTPEKETTKLNFWKIAAVILLLITIGLIYQYEIQPNKEKVNTIVKRKTSVQTPVESPNETLFSDNNTSLNIVKAVKPQIASATLKIKEDKQENLAIDNEVLPSQETFEESKTIQNSQIVISKTPVKYITAEDLLFEREVQKTIENKSKNSKIVHVPGFEKPKEISLLGITLYEESK